VTPPRKGIVTVAVIAGLFAAGQATIARAGAATITTTPATLGTPGNCFPFGIGGGGGQPWEPNAGFVYKNIPAFQLNLGDTIGFDLGAVNDVDVQLDVAFAAATSNGGDVPAGSFTTVATNAQTPANPRGDTTAGDYELRWAAQAPFNFPGGGLITRFSNPSASYALDATCNLVAYDGVTSFDTSGFFVERFIADPDGTAPWDQTDNGPIVPIQLTLADVPPASPGPPVKTGKRKKCKKKKHKRSASASKKKCKRKRK
jgi:hypothetical protein